MRTLAFHSAIAARFSFLKQRTAICGMRNLDGIDEAERRDGCTVVSTKYRELFAKQLHFDPSDKDAVELPDFSEGAAVISGILRGIQIFSERAVR